MELSQEHAGATGIHEELGEAVGVVSFSEDLLLPINTPD